MNVWLPYIHVHVSIKRPTVDKVLIIFLGGHGFMLQIFLLIFTSLYADWKGEGKEGDIETKGRLMEGATCAVDCHIITHP